jgi:hypothetical protein
MSEETKVKAGGRKTTSNGSGAGKRPSPFAIATMIAGAIAMSLIVWRISKAWRIEYGGGPREARPIPTGGSFGSPADLVRPAPPSTGR